MSLATLIQLAAACIGIIGSMFFAIGIIRQNAAAMAHLSGTYYNANPHMPPALAAQKADYVFGGGLIVVAFALQLASFFSTSPEHVIRGYLATLAPWVALVITIILLLALRLASTWLAKHYQSQVEEAVRKDEEEYERQRQERKMQPNKAVNADAQVRPLPSVAPVLVRRLPLR